MQAFFFDLSIWGDETPVDDPGQALGSDRALLIAVFSSAYNRTQAPGYTGPQMLHVGGFTPWWFKYTKDGPGEQNSLSACGCHGGIRGVVGEVEGDPVGSEVVGGR